MSCKAFWPLRQDAAASYMHLFSWYVFLVFLNLGQLFSHLSGHWCSGGVFHSLGLALCRHDCPGEMPVVGMPLKQSVRPAASLLEAQSVPCPSFPGGSGVGCLVKAVSGLSGCQAYILSPNGWQGRCSATRRSCSMKLPPPHCVWMTLDKAALAALSGDHRLPPPMCPNLSASHRKPSFSPICLSTHLLKF